MLATGQITIRWIAQWVLLTFIHFLDNSALELKGTERALISGNIQRFDDAKNKHRRAFRPNKKACKQARQARNLKIPIIEEAMSIKPHLDPYIGS